jgi:hypothetical protein
MEEAPEKFTLGKDFAPRWIACFHKGFLGEESVRADGRPQVQFEISTDLFGIPDDVRSLINRAGEFDVSYGSMSAGECAVLFPPLNSTLYRLESIQDDYIAFEKVPDDKISASHRVLKKSFCVPLSEGKTIRGIGHLEGDRFTVSLVEPEAGKPRRVKINPTVAKASIVAAGDLVELRKGKHKLLRIVPPNDQLPTAGWIELDPEPAK